jgi:hypothetical protein
LPTLGCAMSGTSLNGLGFVQLAQAAADYNGGKSVRRERWVGDIRNYCVFVRISLQQLVDGAPLPNPGAPAYPDLWRDNDEALWTPTVEPIGWLEALQIDPEHPQYRPVQRPG